MMELMSALIRLRDDKAKKYLGVDKYPFRREGEVRLTYKIQPERVNAFSPQR
jgi:hypothetical protein